MDIQGFEKAKGKGSSEKLEKICIQKYVSGF